MQVRTSHSTSGTDQAYNLTLRHSLTLRHQGLAEVTVHGDKTLTMVEKNGFTVVIQIIHQRDFTRRRRANFAAGGSRNI
jgi:hypothetical protein